MTQAYCKFPTEYAGVFFRRTLTHGIIVWRIFTSNHLSIFGRMSRFLSRTYADTSTNESPASGRLYYTDHISYRVI